MLPFLTVCNRLQIPVLVMNPNLSRDPATGASIPGSQRMDQHAVFVWNSYVKDSGFNKISIVAHSAGGGCVSAIQSQFADSFYDQVSHIAYTDSWVTHRESLSEQQQKFMFERAIHF